MGHESEGVKPGVYFDTNALSRGDGRLRGPALGELLRPTLAEVGSQAFVPDLVVQEIAYQRFRGLMAHVRNIRAAEAALKLYAPLGSLSLPQDRVLRDQVMEEVSREVEKLSSCTIFRAWDIVHLYDLLEMSLDRVPPFRTISVGRRDEVVGLHDAVILRASLGHAARRGQPAIFVTQDTDYGAALDPRLLSAAAGRPFHLVRSAKEAANLLRLYSFAGPTTEFVVAEKHAVAYGIENQLKVSIRGKDRVLFGIGIGGVYITLAYPSQRPESGKACPITFQGMASGEIWLEEVAELGTDGAWPLDPSVQISVSFSGQAEAIYEGEAFRQPLVVKSAKADRDDENTNIDPLIRLDQWKANQIKINREVPE